MVWRHHLAQAPLVDVGHRAGDPSNALETASITTTTTVGPAASGTSRLPAAARTQPPIMAGPTPNRPAAQRASIAPETAPTPPAAKIRRRDPLTVATYVLIHGAGDGGWYWHLLEAELRDRGHDVVAPDLPSEDDGAGLLEHADTAVEAVGRRTGLVVVGQSSGGFTAPLVCDRVPADLLVLLAGMVPRPGERPDDWWANTGYRRPGASRTSATAARRRTTSPCTSTTSPRTWPTAWRRSGPSCSYWGSARIRTMRYSCASRASMD
jgi:Alpha/beta hydrolase family